jgi:DHA3 family tetracycline resistance protein-like MFS transporter
MAKLGAERTWLLYKGAVAFALALGWTLAPVFFVRELHMSPLALVLTGTAFEVGIFVFEIPTGIVADRYGRRLSVIVGLFVVGAAFVITGLAPGTAVVIAAAALMGFGRTFGSGAEDAWLADEVGLENMGRSYQRGAQVGRVGALAGIGMAVALALGDLRLPVVAGGLVLVALGIVLALVMPETGFQPAERGDLTPLRSLAATGVEGARLIRATPVLVLIVGIAFFQGASGEALGRLWEAHFLRDVGVPRLLGLDAVVWFGVIAAASLLLTVLVAQPLVSRLERLSRGGMARLLMALDALLVAAMLGFALAGSFAFAVATYLASRLAQSLGDPVQAAWVNSNVEDSRVRATVISVTSVGNSVGELSGGPGLGAIGNVFGIRAALAAGAFVLLPGLVLFGRAIRHHGREPALERPVPAATV